MDNKKYGLENLEFNGELVPNFELSGIIYDKNEKLNASQIEKMFMEWVENNNLFFFGIMDYKED